MCFFDCSYARRTEVWSRFNFIYTAKSQQQSPHGALCCKADPAVAGESKLPTQTVIRPHQFVTVVFLVVLHTLRET